MRLLQAFCLFASIFSISVAQAQQFTTNIWGDPAIEGAIANYDANFATVGLGLVIVHDGEIVYLRGYGMEDAEANVAVDPKQTRFRWASVAKTFASAIAVRAETQGRLDLDTNVTSYYPSYVVPKKYYVNADLNNGQALPSDQQHISLRKLLTHTSGIQHYNNGLSPAAPPSWMTSDNTVNTGMEWALDMWKSNPLLFVPGYTTPQVLSNGDDYSTPAVNLAGVVLENKLGGHYEKLVKAVVADPAKMTTLRADTLWNKAPRRAVGYLSDSTRDPVDDDISWKLAAGGFVSTVEDMGKYAQAMLNETILTDDEKDEMWTRHVQNDGTELNRGLSWFTNTANIEHVNFRVRHTGSQRKSRSVLAIYPNRDLAIGIMTNSSFNCGTTSLANEIYAIIQARLDGGQPAIQTQLELVQLAIAPDFYNANQIYKSMRSR